MSVLIFLVVFVLLTAVPVAIMYRWPQSRLRFAQGAGGLLSLSVLIFIFFTDWLFVARLAGFICTLVTTLIGAIWHAEDKRKELHRRWKF